MVKEGTTPKVPTFKSRPIGKAKTEEAQKPIATKAPAPTFEDDHVGSLPPPQPQEPRPDDIPKGEEVPQVKRIKAPPEEDHQGKAQGNHQNKPQSWKQCVK